jgi:hypothetical protein
MNRLPVEICKEFLNWVIDIIIIIITISILIGTPAPRPHPSGICLSAMNRLPVEIWEEILDWVIDIPFFFDLGCTLDNFYDWTTKQKEISRQATELYACSESRRLVLRKVCRAWQAFSDSREGRWANGDRVVARSRHVSIDVIREEYYTRQTKWETVNLHCVLHPAANEYGAPILRLAENHEKHRRIQRMHLKIQMHWLPAQCSGLLLESLAAFSNLRALRLDIDLANAPSQPIMLSQLTSLQWVSRAFCRRPHECLILPSLKSLGVSITGYTDDPAALIAPYQHTLEHLILGYEVLNEVAVSCWKLPPWESYPHLVELAIDTRRTPIPSIPSPPPPGHPLKSFRIPKWDSHCIKALFGQKGHQNHLESIIVTHLRWRESVIAPTDHFAEVGDHHLQNGVMSVIQLCVERGVRLEDGLHKTVQESDPAALGWYQACASPEPLDHSRQLQTSQGE